MQRLYELGARRVLVTGTGPLGCAPSQLAMRSRNGECVPVLQQAAQIFNPQLVQMTENLNRQVGADVFVAVNAYLMNMDFINYPQRFGLFHISLTAFNYILISCFLPSDIAFVFSFLKIKTYLKQHTNYLILALIFTQLNLKIICGSYIILLLISSPIF